MRQEGAGSLHLAVALFGLAALVGAGTGLDPMAITLGRAAVAGLALSLLLLFRPRLRPRAVRDLLPWAAGAGLLLALHWSCFFTAVRRGGVPVALLGYASFPAFGLLIEQLEPLLRPTARRRPLGVRHLLALTLLAGGLGLLAAGGSSGDPGAEPARGLAAALAAGATFALLTRLNSGRVERIGAVPLAAAQMLGAALWLLPFAAPRLVAASPRAWGLLLVLGLVCTALAHTLFIQALRRVTPFQAGIAAGLEPVYGVLAAVALTGIQPRPGEWAALPLIVGAALLAREGRKAPGGQWAAGR